MALESYKQLIVWQKSIDLAEEVYALTNHFPNNELYGLTSQMRRAAVSIASNIAEGSRRKDVPEYIHFLRIADGSSAELETQIVIAKRIYQNEDCFKIDGLLTEIQKMLNKMKASLALRKTDK